MNIKIRQMVQFFLSVKGLLLLQSLSIALLILLLWNHYQKPSAHSRILDTSIDSSDKSGRTLSEMESVRADLASLQKQTASIASEVSEISRKMNISGKSSKAPSLVTDPTAIQQIKATDKKILLMKIRLNKAYKEGGKYPQTVEEFTRIMGKVPVEDQSGSAKVSLDKDYRGGWFYNKNTGEVAANIE